MGIEIAPGDFDAFYLQKDQPEREPIMEKIFGSVVVGPQREEIYIGVNNTGGLMAIAKTDGYKNIESKELRSFRAIAGNDQLTRAYLPESITKVVPYSIDLSSSQIVPITTNRGTLEYIELPLTTPVQVGDQFFMQEDIYRQVPLRKFLSYFRVNPEWSPMIDFQDPRTMGVGAKRRKESRIALCIPDTDHPDTALLIFFINRDSNTKIPQEVEHGNWSVAHNFFSTLIAGFYPLRMGDLGLYEFSDLLSAVQFSKGYQSINRELMRDLMLLQAIAEYEYERDKVKRTMRRWGILFKSGLGTIPGVQSLFRTTGEPQKEPQTLPRPVLARQELIRSSTPRDWIRETAAHFEYLDVAMDVAELETDVRGLERWIVEIYKKGEMDFAPVNVRGAIARLEQYARYGRHKDRRTNINFNSALLRKRSPIRLIAKEAANMLWLKMIDLGSQYVQERGDFSIMDDVESELYPDDPVALPYRFIFALENIARQRPDLQPEILRRLNTYYYEERYSDRVVTLSGEFHGQKIRTIIGRLITRLSAA